jgi:hypothetical protein
MLFQSLEYLVRIEVEVAHDLAEHVPLHLGKCQADVLVGQERMVAATSFVEGPVHDSLGRLGHLVLRNVEILHGGLQRESHRLGAARSADGITSKRKASRKTSPGRRLSA